MNRIAILVLGLAIPSAFVLRGSFGHAAAVIAIGTYIGLPLLLFMGIWLLVGFGRSGVVPRGLREMFHGSMIVGFSLAISVGLGRFLNDLEIRRARDFVAAIVPILEEYRAGHGRYPGSLDAVLDSRPPSLLREPHGYRSEGGSYRFEYWDPAGIMDGYCFDGSTREWDRFD